MTHNHHLSSSGIPEEPSHHVMEQAAEWYGLLRSGDAVDADKDRWKSWLDSDPEHQQAWQYVEAVSQQFSQIKSQTQSRELVNGLHEANQRVVRRRQLLFSMAALLGTGALGWLSWNKTPLPVLVNRLRGDHSTSIGEIKEVVLNDGTQLWLNTASAVNQIYSADRRLLELLGGEILINTADDKTRSFWVKTDHGSLRALGTEFTVRKKGNETLLTVFDGAVEITTRSGKKRVIESGEQTYFTNDLIGQQETANIARKAWHRDMFVAKDIPLSLLVDELRRYRQGHIGLAPELNDLKVFGSFPLQDTNKALELLAFALPVDVKQTLPWWVSIEPQKARK